MDTAATATRGADAARGALMARIEPIPAHAWPSEMATALAALAPAGARHPRPTSKGRPKAANALGSYAHHPALAQAFLTFNGHIMSNTTLTPRQRELIILRVAHVRECEYEWGQHVILGRDAGLDDDDIRRVACQLHAEHWSATELALLQSVDELTRDGAISVSTWASLSNELDARQLLDVIFTVGAYETIAFMFRSLDLEPDDDLKSYLAAARTSRAHEG